MVLVETKLEQAIYHVLHGTLICWGTIKITKEKQRFLAIKFVKNNTISLQHFIATKSNIFSDLTVDGSVYSKQFISRDFNENYLKTLPLK